MEMDEGSITKVFTSLLLADAVQKEQAARRASPMSQRAAPNAL
jgi:hypothetical protein